MATDPSSTRFSDAPEVARFDGLEPSNKHEKYKPFFGYNAPRENRPASTSESRQPSETRQICGLRRTTFFLSLALATVVVLAAAIGGGVGATTCGGSKNVDVAAADNNSPTATLTVTSTITMSSATTQPSTSGSAPSASPTITTSCPFSNNTVYNSLFKDGSNGSPGPNAGLDYIVYCDMNFASGLGPHLAQVYAISFDDCIEACASYNFWTDTTDCEQVAYKLDGSRPGNCWIGTKNASEALTFESSNLDIAFLQ